MEVYVVTKYYIGPMNRYDGTGNTDRAQVWVFSTQKRAIDHIIMCLEQYIQEYNDGTELDEQLPALDSQETDRLLQHLTTYGYCAFRETDMYAIDVCDVNV